RNAVQGTLDRHRHLLFNLFGGVSGRRGDDNRLGIGYIGVRLDAQLSEAPDTGGNQAHTEQKRQKALAERQAKECADHERLTRPLSSMTPSTATISPACRPPTTRTRSPAGRPRVTPRCSKRPGAVSTYTTARPSVSTTAASGTTTVAAVDSMW